MGDVAYRAPDGPYLVDVRACGAKGNGTTDDTAAIQAALNYLNDPAANFGAAGTVFFPKGVYKITSPLIVPAVNGYMQLRILGEGYNSIILNRNTNAGQEALRIGSTTVNSERACTFEVGNLSIVGTKGTSAPGIKLYKGQWGYMHDLAIQVPGNGIDCEGSLGCTFSRVHIWPAFLLNIIWNLIDPLLDPESTEALIGFNFVSDSTTNHAINTTRFDDCTVNHGTNAYYFKRSVLAGTSREYWIYGGFSQNLTDDVIKQVGATVGPGDHLRISDHHIELIPDAKYALNIELGHYLLCENVVTATDVDGNYADVKIVQSHHVTFINCEFGLLELVGAAEAASCIPMRLINTRFNEGVNPAAGLTSAKANWFFGGRDATTAPSAVVHAHTDSDGFITRVERISVPPWYWSQRIAGGNVLRHIPSVDEEWQIEDAAEADVFAVHTGTKVVRLGALGRLRLPVLVAAPASPANGDIAYADGSGWNPGAGAGFYGYQNSSWQKVPGGDAAGTLSAGRATMVDSGGVVHKTVFTFTLTGAEDLDLADGDHGIGKQFFQFPQGRISILGATIDAVVTPNTAFNATPNDTFKVGVGTVTAADDNDLTGTEQDIIPATTLDTNSGSGAAIDLHAAMSTGAQFDGTTTAIALFANVACADANNSGATTYAITGTLTVVWSLLGDF